MVVFSPRNGIRRLTEISGGRGRSMEFFVETCGHNTVNRSLRRGGTQAINSLISCHLGDFGTRDRRCC